MTGIAIRPSQLDRTLARQWNMASSQQRSAVSLKMRRRYEAAVERCRLWDIALSSPHQKTAPPTMPSMSEILTAVCQTMDVAHRDLTSESKKQKLVAARKVFFALAYSAQIKCPSLTKVGRFVCRDHTTVIYGIRGVANDRGLEMAARSVIATHLPPIMMERFDWMIQKYRKPSGKMSLPEGSR